MLLGMPERKVPLPGQGKPSFSDLFVLAKSRGDLIAMAVEGKVSEEFDALVSDWLRREPLRDHKLPGSYRGE